MLFAVTTRFRQPERTSSVESEGLPKLLLRIGRHSNS